MTGFHFNPPFREDYDSEDEYLDAYERWEDAESEHAEECMERRREELN